MADLRTRFGKLVAAHRRRLGWTQEELCARASISVDMVSRIESGATGVRFATITKLADALAVDPAELFTPELAGGALERAKLADLTATLAKLSDRDLDWVGNVLSAVLKHR